MDKSFSSDHKNSYSWRIMSVTKWPLTLSRIRKKFMFLSSRKILWNKFEVSIIQSIWEYNLCSCSMSYGTQGMIFFTKLLFKFHARYNFFLFFKKLLNNQHMNSALFIEFVKPFKYFTLFLFLFLFQGIYKFCTAEPGFRDDVL